MLSGIFLIAGVNHVAFPGHVAKKLMESPVYENVLFFMNAEILVMATGIGLLAGGIFLLLNKFTRLAAILLLLLLIPITISVQLQGWSTAGPLFKNVAIAGALLFFITNNFESIKPKKYEAQS
jgi:putative oxidoreductase